MPDCVALRKGGIWCVRFLRDFEIIEGPWFSVREHAVHMSAYMRRWIAEKGSMFSLIGLQIAVSEELQREACSVVDSRVFAEPLGKCSPHELYALRGEDSLEARTARHKARKARRKLAKRLKV